MLLLISNFCRLLFLCEQITMAAAVFSTLLLETLRCDLDLIKSFFMTLDQQIKQAKFVAIESLESTQHIPLTQYLHLTGFI